MAFVALVALVAFVSNVSLISSLVLTLKASLGSIRFYPDRLLCLFGIYCSCVLKQR